MIEQINLLVLDFKGAVLYLFHEPTGKIFRVVLILEFIPAWEVLD